MVYRKIIHQIIIIIIITLYFKHLPVYAFTVYMLHTVCYAGLILVTKHK